MTGPDRAWLDEMAAAYERWLVPVLFAPFAADLVRRALQEPAGRVLELAAGTGVLSRELLARSPATELVATDLNPPMVRIARDRVPRAKWLVADALSIPFRDDAFDLVLCQFGVMFLPDKPAAFAEIGRVLRPGGRLLFSAWDSIDTHGFASPLQSALERMFPEAAPDFMARTPHGYHDPDRIRRDLRAAGLQGWVETIELTGTANSAADLATGFGTGTPLGPQLSARQDLKVAVERLAAELTAELGTGPVTAAMRAHVGGARAV